MTTYRPLVLFCDVDRTLLTHGHELLPRVERAMAAAAAEGLRVVLATARSPRGVEPFRARLNLAAPIICFNGAWVGDGQAMTPWQERPIPLAHALDIARFCDAAGHPAMWYLADEVQTLPGALEPARHQAEVTGDRLVVRPAVDALEGAPSKIMVVAEPDEVDRVLSDLRAAFGHLVACVRSGPSLIEVIHRDVNKAHAAAFVAAHLGVAASDCAAAGDSENDLEMLRWAGLPLTVANGVAEARRIARFVGGSCDAGGAADLVDWLLALPRSPGAGERNGASPP